MLCPDKLTTREWLAVVEAAHRTGLRTTSTIMFGHLDRPRNWWAPASRRNIFVCISAWSTLLMVILVDFPACHCRPPFRSSAHVVQVSWIGSFEPLEFRS